MQLRYFGRIGIQCRQNRRVIRLKSNTTGSAYDYSKEDTLWGMARDFYSRKMLSTAIFVWGASLAFLAPTIYCGVKFFQAEQIQSQILHATIFICCVQCMCLMKIFAWQMILKHNLARKIKRLERYITKLNEAVRSKA